MKFVPNGPINNISALAQIMAWRQAGDKPLSEPLMVRLPTHYIYSEQHEKIKYVLEKKMTTLFNSLRLNDSYMHQ